MSDAGVVEEVEGAGLCTLKPPSLRQRPLEAAAAAVIQLKISKLKISYIAVDEAQVWVSLTRKDYKTLPLN